MNATRSFFATRKPERPSSTISGSDATRKATTGFPHDIASWGASGKPSKSDGKTNTSARLRIETFSTSGT